MSTLNKLLYQNITNSFPVTIQAGQSISDPFECTNKTMGCGTIRALELPANFTTSSIYFIKYKTDQFLAEDARVIVTTDGADYGVYELLNVDISTFPEPPSFALIPAAFDTVVYLKIATSVPQVETTTMNLVLAANLYDTKI